MSNIATMPLGRHIANRPHFQEYVVGALKNIGERKEGELYSPLTVE